jgi:glutamate-1-semialdehyde aminotransferase
VARERLGAQLEAGLRRAADKAGVPVVVNRVGSILTGFFTELQPAELSARFASSLQIRQTI